MESIAIVNIIETKYGESQKNKLHYKRKNIEAYQGIRFSLFMDWKYSYLTLTPAFYYKDRNNVSKEENKEFSDRFMEQICKMQANKNYAAYIKHWINIIFQMVNRLFQCIHVILNQGSSLQLSIKVYLLG